MTESENEIPLGRVIGIHGLSGEVAVRTTGDTPEGLGRYAEVTWEPPRGAPRRLRIEGCRVHKGVALVTFGDVTDADTAEALVGGTLKVTRRDLPPAEEGRHYVVDLIGIKVESAQGEPIGVVTEVIETGANDVFVVDAGGREVLIPSVDHVVKEIDMTGRRMVIEVLPGLLD